MDPELDLNPEIGVSMGFSTRKHVRTRFGIPGKTQVRSRYGLDEPTPEGLKRSNSGVSGWYVPSPNQVRVRRIRGQNKEV
ncbi:hypothetical protein KY362_03305 [Candidatus Woesearchaeota archaeon]|nr:hypothetical protein [Candidatus Woesearchaeota archaeon]